MKKETATNKNVAETASDVTKETSEAVKAEINEKAKSKDVEKQSSDFKKEGDLIIVISKERANKKIVARTGKVIDFDANGKALIDLEDALYLKGISGFEF